MENLKQEIESSAQQLIEKYWRAMVTTRQLLGREDIAPETPDWAWTLLEPFYGAACRETQSIRDSHSDLWLRAMMRAYQKGQEQHRSAPAHF